MPKNEYLEENEKILYTQRFSLFRILTNTTLNVILVIAFIILCLQYLVPGFMDYIVPLLALQFGLLAVIGIITYHDYRGSVFFITDKRLIYIVCSQQPKKWINLEYKDIDDVYTSSYNVIVLASDGRKLKMEILSHPKRIVEEINKQRKES